MFSDFLSLPLENVVCGPSSTSYPSQKKSTTTIIYTFLYRFMRTFVANRINVMNDGLSTIERTVSADYKYGFITDIEADEAPKGLNEDIVRFISSKKNEPEWMLEWRLKAYRHWLTMQEPEWANVKYPKIDYQDIVYYSAPKPREKKASLDEVDPELLDTFEKLGIPLTEQKMLAGVAVDAIFDSVSVATTFKEKLLKEGVVFCSFSDAVRDYPELVKKYLGSVVPYTDNY